MKDATVETVALHKIGTPRVKKWMSPKPESCDICHRNLDTLTAFIDGVTATGQWAIMCLTCHKYWGMGLGLGKGQRYSLATLEKTHG